MNTKHIPRLQYSSHTGTQLNMERYFRHYVYIKSYRVTPEMYISINIYYIRMRITCALNISSHFKVK